MANIMLDALRGLIMGAAGDALFPKRETPAPVEDRSVQMPPAQPQGASIQAASPRPVNRNPMVPIDQAPVATDPMNQGINQDMAGFAQQQPKKIDVVNQQLNQQVQEELKQLKPEAAELASQQEIMDSAYAYTLAKNSPTYAQVQEDPELGSDFQNTLKKAFGNEEMWLTLAMGFNGMRLRPDATLGNALADRLKTIRASKKSNRTVQALRARGMNNIADYIEQTGDVPGGMKMAVQAGQYVSGTGKEIEEKFGIKGLIPNKPYRFNTLTKKVEGVGGGDTIFEATKPSKGYQFVRDESGKILYEEPIPKKLTPEMAGTKIQSADLVLDEMNRLTDLINESPMTTTGFGTWLSSIPTTSARDAQALAGTIKANIGFDRLQRMREESPTGGALGQVAVQELQALQSTLGSLDLGQSSEAVLYNVNRLKQQYAKTMLALADAQPNFNEYFPDFNRKVYEDILKGSTAKQTTKPSITPEQAAEELKRRRGQ